jgi:hypothetical protein
VNSILSTTAEDAKTETAALSVILCIFPNEDAERIDGQVRTVVNTVVYWAANDIGWIKQKKVPGKRFCLSGTFFLLSGSVLYPGYLENLLFIKLPTPMSPMPSKSMLTGSEIL